MNLEDDEYYQGIRYRDVQYHTEDGEEFVHYIEDNDTYSSNTVGTWKDLE